MILTEMSVRRWSANSNPPVCQVSVLKAKLSDKPPRDHYNTESGQVRTGQFMPTTSVLPLT